MKVPVTARGAAAACLALLAGCASAGVPLAKAAITANSTIQPGAATIAAGDILDVHFGGKTEWDHEIKVQADGTASFLSLAPMMVEGLSVVELERRLEESYAGVLPQPNLSVGVKTYGNRNVYVMGDVHEPGEFPLEGKMSLLEAISRAGGPIKETALMKCIVLVRWVPTTKKQYAWKIDAREDRWGAGEPLMLQPADVIFIPNTPIDEVDIWVDQYIRRLLPFPYLLQPYSST